MAAHLRSGLRAGIVFSIITVFLVLIGFNVIAGGLIGDMLHNTQASEGAAFGLSAAALDMLIFLGLVGMWAGAAGARRQSPDSWPGALLAGTLSGLIVGLMVAGLAYLLGSMAAVKVEVSRYLAALIPDVLRLFVLGLPVPQAALTYAWFFTASGLAGALLARGMVRAEWRRRVWTWLGARLGPAWAWLTRQPLFHTHAARLVTYALVGVALLILPLRLGQYWNYTAGTVGIYVLLGLGLNIVVGLAGLLDLGYVAFFAIGAYTMALLTAPVPHHLMWSFWAALPAGVIMAALAGILLGIPVLRMRGDYLAIVTLGFGEIIRVLSKSDALTKFSGGPRGVPAVGGPTFFGGRLSTDVGFVYLIILGVLLVIFVTDRLQKSRVGRAWVAMREDETVAQAVGISTLRHKLLAFAIGAAFAGLGGALFAARNQFTGPEDHNLMVSINVLCLVIVGGMGSIPGVIAGAFVLKGLPEVLRQLQDYRILAFGALLVVMMIARPEGLIPSARRSLEIHGEHEEAAPGGPPSPPGEGIP
ncbi:MAG: leucine/isoleucine/valine transporter permease subunit [Chloroflexi bacterium]|nr:leucine/isoleucine/valine transporter permease subunit [Chloroflexota bacterium]